MRFPDSFCRLGWPLSLARGPGEGRKMGPKAALGGAVAARLWLRGERGGCNVSQLRPLHASMVVEGYGGMLWPPCGGTAAGYEGMPLSRFGYPFIP